MKNSIYPSHKNTNTKHIKNGMEPSKKDDLENVFTNRNKRRKKRTEKNYIK